MQIGWYSFFLILDLGMILYGIFDTHNHHLLYCEIFEISNVDNMVHVHQKRWLVYHGQQRC